MDGTRLTVLADGLVTVYTLVEDDPVGAPDPAGARGVTIAPNPFNPRTTIAFTMRRGGRATVEVHDLRGRRLRTLAAALPAGPARLPMRAS